MTSSSYDAPVLGTMSAVGVGTAPMGSFRGGPLWWGEQDEAASVQTIHTALDAGVNWIDTAPMYGWGRAEEVVGRALRGRRRDAVTVLTKCGTIPAPDRPGREDLRPEIIRSDVEGSLRRLGLDHLDVVQFHDPDPAVPIEESWGALGELIEAGLVGAGGLSNHEPGDVRRAHALHPVAVVQHQLSLVYPEALGADLDVAREVGAVYLAWSPLASGLLAGSPDEAQREPGHVVARRLMNDPGLGARAEAARASLVRLAPPLGLAPSQLALVWVLRSGSRAIVGARAPEEILDAVAAAATIDRADVVAAVDQLERDRPGWS